MTLLIFFFLSMADSDISHGQSQILSIRKVRLNHKTFEPASNQSVTLLFEINKLSDLEISIYDRLGTRIKHFKIPKAKPGLQSIKWNGRNEEGKLASGNTFLYIIQGTSDSEKVIYNPAQKSGGIIVKPHKYTFDKKTGMIEYVLPNACMVRLRVGLKDGMLARTIYDWKPQTAGRHTMIWDGKDSSGLMNLMKHPALDLNLTCYTLPQNTIIIKGNGQPFDSDKAKSQVIHDLRNISWSVKGKYVHYAHDPRICHDPKFKVSFPAKTGIDSNGSVIVSGITPIRVEIDKRDIKDLVNKRFEIMLFVDGVFIFEMEEGTSPFTFNWNTKGLFKGPHIISVNLMSYDDHIGVVSQKVIIGE